MRTVWGLTVVFMGPRGEGGGKPCHWAPGCFAYASVATFARTQTLQCVEAAEDAGQSFVTALEHRGEALALRLNWVTCSAGAGEEGCILCGGGGCLTLL